MSFTVGENVGPYRIIAQLGQGGMATVYRAYHAALDRYVALKVLHPAFLEDPNFLARFQREARVVAKLDHPNIVPIYDYAEHGGRPYLVMKFIEGATLKAALERGSITSERTLQIVKLVGAALSFAHKQGILHRDIKPSNVLLSDDGQIYLADFGLARIAQSGSSTLTSDMVLGTPQYISPEQALGKRDLDEGTDIYSFGVMLYELAVGKVPFSADTPFSVIHDHIYSPLPLPHTVNPTVSVELERVLLKALSKERTDRYKDVQALVDAFEKAWSVSPPPEPLALETTVKVQPSPPPAEPVVAETVRAEPVDVSTEVQAGEVSDVVLEPTAEKLEGIRTIAAEPLSVAPASEEIKPVKVVVAESPTPPVVTRTPFQEAPVSPSGKKKPWLWIAVAFVLFMVILFGLVFLRGIQRRRQVVAVTQTARVQLVVSTPTPKPVATRAYPPGVLFQADFTNGEAPKELHIETAGSRWIARDDALCANGAARAGIAGGDGWKDYAVKFRLKLEEGVVFLNLRQHNVADGENRYMVAIAKSDVTMNKQVGSTLQDNLSYQNYFFPPNSWYEITMVAQGNRLLMLVNGVIVVDFTDTNAPLDSGTFTLDALDGASTCVDDVIVYDLTGKPRFDLLYEQRFDNDQVLKGWDITNAEGKPNQSWQIRDGALCGNWHNWAVLRDIPLGDFKLIYHLYMKSGSAHLNFRLGNNYRYYIFVDTAGSAATLSKDTKEQPGIQLADVGVQLRPDRWYTITLQMLGGHIQFLADNTPVYQFTDPSPLGVGVIGFESLDAQGMCIDDIVITMPSLVKNP